MPPDIGSVARPRSTRSRLRSPRRESSLNQARREARRPFSQVSTLFADVIHAGGDTTAHLDAVMSTAGQHFEPIPQSTGATDYAVGACQSATATAAPTAAAIVHQNAVRSEGAFSRNRLRRVGHDASFLRMMSNAPVLWTAHARRDEAEHCLFRPTDACAVSRWARRPRPTKWVQAGRARSAGRSLHRFPQRV